jgi:hypothetical protein
MVIRSIRREDHSHEQWSVSPKKTVEFEPLAKQAVEFFGDDDDNKGDKNDKNETVATE